MADRYYTLISGLPNLEKKSLPNQQQLLEFISSELHDDDYRLAELLVMHSFPDGLQHSILELETSQTLIKEAISCSQSELLQEWIKWRSKLRQFQLFAKTTSISSGELSHANNDLFIELEEVFDGNTLDALLREIHPAEAVRLEKQMFLKWLNEKAFSDVFSLDAVYNYILRYTFLWEENTPNPDWKSKLLQAEIPKI